MERRQYGYVRVSSFHQNEDRQLQAMMELSIPRKNLFIDKQSGKDFDRAQYQKLVKKLRSGDVLFVKSIDRLGRNYREILQQWELLTKRRGVDVVVLDMPLLDTRRDKDLLGAFISDVVLQILSFVAENERVNIRQRQREGINAAKQRGVRFGRPKRELPENFVQMATMWRAGFISSVAAAKECDLPISTFRTRALGLSN